MGVRIEKKMSHGLIYGLHMGSQFGVLSVEICQSIERFYETIYDL